MVVSRSSSDADDRARPTALGRALRGLLVLALLGAPACVTVRPDEKEFLAQPAMTFGSEAEVGAQEDHVLTNREGSAGAGGFSGGGCGCN